ncbi:hypothetical protein ACJMK2_011231 [Sinanodonta woodiana]|uniref:Chitin-binding type-2 domain-containing protein n=1 Tax=Sinanodonta woodiana TaxID=1069815 RepID=A0ABD3V7H7_SINWO
MKFLLKISGFLFLSQAFSLQDPPPFVPAGQEAQKVYAQGEISRNGLPITQWGIGGGTVEPVLPEETVTPTPDPRTTTPSWNQMQGAKNPYWGVNQTWWLQNDTFRSWDHRTTTPSYWDPRTVTPSFSEVYNNSNSNSSQVNTSSIFMAGEKPIVATSLNADSFVSSYVQNASDPASVIGNYSISLTGSSDKRNLTFANVNVSYSGASIGAYATSLAGVAITERTISSKIQEQETNASSYIASQSLNKPELQASKQNTTAKSTISPDVDLSTTSKPTDQPYTSSVTVKTVVYTRSEVGGVQIAGGVPIISMETGNLGFGLDMNLVEEQKSNVDNVHAYANEDGARIDSIIPLDNVVGNGHDPHSPVKPIELAPGTIEAMQSSSEKKEPVNIQSTRSFNVQGNISISTSDKPFTPSLVDISSEKAFTLSPVYASSTYKPGLVNTSTTVEVTLRVEPIAQANAVDQLSASNLSTYVHVSDILTQSETVRTVASSTPILLIRQAPSFSADVSQGAESKPLYPVDSITNYIFKHAVRDTNTSAQVETTTYDFTETMPTSTPTFDDQTTEASSGTMGGGIVIGLDHPFVMSDFGNGTDVHHTDVETKWSAASAADIEKVKSESKTTLTSSTLSSPVVEKQSRDPSISPAVYIPPEHIVIHEQNTTTIEQTPASTKAAILRAATTTITNPPSTATTKTTMILTTAKLPVTTTTTQASTTTTTTEEMTTTTTATLPPPTTRTTISFTTTKRPITTIATPEPTTAPTTEETRTTLPPPATSSKTISSTTNRPIITTTTQVPTTTTTTTTPSTTTTTTKATTATTRTTKATTETPAITMLTRKPTTTTLTKAAQTTETLAATTSYQVTTAAKAPRPSAVRSTPLKPDIRGDPIIVPHVEESTLPVGPIGTPVSLESLCADTFQTIFVDSVGYTSYPGHCDKVIQCFNFRDRIFPVVRECPYGFFWDQELAQCREPVNVLCFDDPCLDFRMSSYKRGRSCRSYFECDFGASAPKCCDAGYEFVYGTGCVQNPTCNDTCDTPVTLNEKLQFSSCKFLPDQDNPFGYITHEHDGIRFRACPSGTIFSEKQCGCRWLASKRQSAHMRMKMCSPDFYMNFNNGFQELSGSNMAFDVSNVILDTGASDFTGDGKIILWGFMNRDLGQNFAIRLKFKADAILSSGTIISNCGMNGGPTIQIALTIENVMFLVKSVERSSPVQVQIPYDPYQWNDVIMFYNGKVLLTGVNGRKRSVPLGGRIETRSNSIVLGGCPMEGKGFEGKIDEIAVYASCVPEFPSN